MKKNLSKLLKERETKIAIKSSRERGRLKKKKLERSLKYVSKVM